MASSQTMNTTVNEIKYHIECVQQSTNIINNTSNVLVRVICNRTDNLSTVGTGNCYCKINGTVYSAGINTNQAITRNGVEIFRMTLDIPHESDGSKLLKLTARIAHSAFSANEQGWQMELRSIPRAVSPVLSPNRVDMGNTMTITIPYLSDQFTYTIKYGFLNAKGVIATKTYVTSHNWTVPMSLAQQIPNQGEAMGNIVVDTYVGDTLIGSTSTNFTAVVPAVVVPSVRPTTITDPTGNFTKYGFFVQNQSKLKVQANASGSEGSTLKSITISALGVSTTNTNPWTSNTITASGNQNVVVKVVDSRNRQVTVTDTINIVAYQKATINTLVASRCNSAGVADDSGDHMRIGYAANISPLNNKNSKRVVVKYKESTASAWIEAVNVQQYSVNSSVVVSADINKTYDVLMSVTDDFGTTERTWSVSTAYTLVDYHNSGRGIAFGKVAELANVFEIDKGMKLVADNSPFVRMGDNVNKSYSNLASFWTDVNEVFKKNEVRICVDKCNITASFDGVPTGWCHYIAMAQNLVGNGSYGVAGRVLWLTTAGVYYMNITGGNYDVSTLTSNIVKL